MEGLALGLRVGIVASGGEALTLEGGFGHGAEDWVILSWDSRDCIL